MPSVAETLAFLTSFFCVYLVCPFLALLKGTRCFEGGKGLNGPNGAHFFSPVGVILIEARVRVLADSDVGQSPASGGEQPVYLTSRWVPGFFDPPPMGPVRGGSYPP